MLIYTLVFGYIIQLDKGVSPYPLYVLAGLIPWTFFNNSVRKGTRALSGNASLIKKVYFPREIFPLTMLISNMVNFIPAFALILVLAVVLGHPMQWSELILLPLVILLQALFTLGVALLVSILNVYYRDVEFIINLVMRAWMYMCPIIYPIHMLTGAEVSSTVKDFAGLYFLNPMAVIISLYHQPFFPDQGPEIKYVIYTVILTVVLFLGAWYLFRRMNRRVGEVI